MALQYPPDHPNFGQSAQPSQAELAAYAVEYPRVPDRTVIWKALMGLDDIWICTLLLRISDTQARVAWEIWDECKKRRRDPRLAKGMALRKKARLSSQEQSLSSDQVSTRRESMQSDVSTTATAAQTTLTFYEEARAIWFMLKREHVNKREAAQIEAASVVYRDIIWVMNHIREQTASTTTSFESRRNALETLRNIGESILNAPGVLGDEVRRRFRGGAGLKDAMVSTLRPMKPEERDRLANINDCQSTFHERVASLAAKGAAYDIFDEMRSVADFLKGEITMRELDKMRSSSCSDDVEIKDEDHLDVSPLNTMPDKNISEGMTNGIKRKRQDPGDDSGRSRAMTIDVQSANWNVPTQSARQDSALGHSSQHQATFSATANFEEPSIIMSSEGESERISTAGRPYLHLPRMVDDDTALQSKSQESLEHPLRGASSGLKEQNRLMNRYAIPGHLDLTD